MDVELLLSEMKKSAFLFEGDFLLEQSIRALSDLLFEGQIVLKNKRTYLKQFFGVVFLLKQLIKDKHGKR